MAEVGLVRYARVALEVAQRVLPAYRTKFSKHKFSQPQLLAILCLMRYEEWTFRETQVRLAEHSELRQALQLESTPDYTTLYRVMRRLEEGHIRKAMASLCLRERRQCGSGCDRTGIGRAEHVLCAALSGTWRPAAPMEAVAQMVDRH